MKFGFWEKKWHARFRLREDIEELRQIGVTSDAHPPETTHTRPVLAGSSGKGLQIQAGIIIFKTDGVEVRLTLRPLGQVPLM